MIIPIIIQFLKAYIIMYCSIIVKVNLIPRLPPPTGMNCGMEPGILNHMKTELCLHLIYKYVIQGFIQEFVLGGGGGGNFVSGEQWA